MHAAYLTFVCLTAIACAYAAYMNLTRAQTIIDTALRLHIPVSLMRPFGVLLGSAGAGLLLGFAVPLLGAAAAAGLVAYFVIAVATHLWARDYHLSWAFMYLSLAAATLASGLLDHGPLG